ncbi:MAG: T9SS type A sorting domain-containing protein [Opitutaceae bacterium]|nr:T9SS type A sorting domain-containing protein [Cytophagales bacterium]
MQAPDEGLVKIFDISGTLLDEIKVQNYLVYGENLKPGIYFIRYESDNISKVI